MSWHHGDYINLISAAGTAIAAAAAAVAAWLSFKSAKESQEQQRKSAKFEMERHLYELLQIDAQRANESVKGIDSMDWSYNQVANLTYAIESARKRLQAAIPQLDDEQIARFKSFFTEQLSHEVKAEMKEMGGLPDALYKTRGNCRESMELVDIFGNNKEFFGYDYLRDSDLED
ncbi:hypothetical protein SNN84_003381 [Cronobacter sakazakii]|uniref:Uncharacterized protein n=2 Tax=Cronobacter sakazakii TaxID=28141 RepID=A0AAN6AVY0_CROSK|nr:hypothetical protein [Cronobacter sakazakii]EGT4276647.1 hypothetical protein [Cronobacter sakazakii]EGT5696398.1 hypothetical protein [Cronobacter sakazakii]EGT5721206.1 hypothetical protein [Cronobacter sakazakii]EGT5725694.1 hypothetical protein [Cronobacter sakazakii]EJG0682709.1 hypothetical protein [Cronobacter sakazakii]